jgi:SAM-dependent methyltransferase
MSEIFNMPELSSQHRRMSIPGLDAWLNSVQGRYVLDWEQNNLDSIVADIFGFNALQIGLPQYDFLQANRIPLRQKAGGSGAVDTLCDPVALPFASQSIDLVILPHVLEFSDDPHQILREIERILIPEGQVLIIGFNPFSLWGAKRRLNRCGEFPWNGSYLSIIRLKDWLKLLGFEVDRGTLGCYAPPFKQAHWLRRSQLIERMGNRWWNFSGAVYVLHAIKRVHSMRLITPNWKKAPVRGKALRPMVQKESNDN